MAEVVDDEEAAAAGIGVGSAIEQVVLSPYAEPLVARPDEEEEAGAKRRHPRRRVERLRR